MTEPAVVARRKAWTAAWPDALAFAGGLAVAGLSGWQTTDLIWSLWLASLVVGYATIVWSISARPCSSGRTPGRTARCCATNRRAAVALAGSAFLVGALFLLAFFTAHFGLFHFVHSVFLQTFFPIGPEGGAGLGPSRALYSTVVKHYWTFLPVAFLAERNAFRLSPEPDGPPDTAVTVAAIAARKARHARAEAGWSASWRPTRTSSGCTC